MERLNRKLEMFDYMGSQFQLEEVKTWYRSKVWYQITDMEVHSDEVWIPDDADGREINNWVIRKESGVFLGVKVLHISKGINYISIRNDIFPDLERVEIDERNEVYFTDGRFIMAHDSMSRSSKGEYLAYCPVCKGEEVWIPDGIKEIRSYAFSGTKYRMIHFPKAEINIAQNAFEGSAWIEDQNYPIVIGNLLYKIEDGANCLEVPENVRRFAPEIFDSNYICNMITPSLPGNALITRINEKGSLRFLTISSSGADINIRLLRKLCTLEEITVADGHSRYRTKDGVMFSEDGSALVYYPPFKKDVKYVIPDGVRKVETSAFINQRYLQEIVMPDSVLSVGAGAFMDCRKLCKVRMSKGVRELPDSCTYQKGGVFEGCKSLEEITLPENMLYLGSFAFYGSGLKRITLNSRLKQIGEYALAAEHLNQVQLPETLQRLGKGSLLYASRIEAYEGSARGLPAAVNAADPDNKDNTSSLCWSRCDVTVLYHDSEMKSRFMIPGNLARSAACYLDMAWNNDRIDYAEYDECFGEIDSADEKLEFAMDGIMRCKPGETNAFTDYIRRVSYKIASCLLEERREEEFLQFLKLDYLSEASLLKLIKLSNELGMTVCTAYLMDRKANKRELVK